ncbi:MAG TPA: DUF1330 domain-containing protein [Fibrobacteria bacterium]|jgi:uncharacterized protein (DUF1330 family)|nr:DUF1330 domain-containing protein [Fibrobacteria bacterium]
MILLATLTVHPDRVEAFREYERKAARIMERHGGRIEKAIALDPDPEDAFYRETHVVSFPDEAALAGYRNDPEFKALAKEREACILATAIRRGKATPGYHEA